MNEEQNKESPPLTDDNQQQVPPLNNTSTDEPIVPATETTSEVEQQQTTNYKPETEDMEVHHHTHASHGKKNWKSYFWEFLMLFLAVFCGFLAEYQLEHKIENDRGKQYTQSFYEDLVSDSSKFRRLINDFQKKLTVFKSMSPCYDSLLSDSPPKNCLATIVSNSLWFPDLIYTDRTLMQLKNAGGLRLLKKADADSILLYDYRLREYIESESTGVQEMQLKIRETITIMLNYDSWKDTTNTPSVVAIYGNNKEILNKYFNQLTIYSNFCQARLNDLKKLKKRNVELIEYFKAKYHYD